MLIINRLSFASICNKVMEPNANRRVFVPSMPQAQGQAAGKTCVAMAGRLNPKKQSSEDGEAETDAATEQELHNNLKRAFDRLSEEPVPDKFLDLIRQLEEKETGTKGPDEDDA